MEQLTYKDSVNTALKGDPSAYTSWKAREQLFTALMALFCILFVGSNVLRIFGYRITALLTPAFVVGMGTFFYITAFSTNTYDYGVSIAGGEAKFGISDSGNGSLMMLAILGLILNVGMQGFKYSVFDSTKEIAYLNLDKEEKTRAKAVGDILGQRGGKSFAALVNCVFLPLFSAKSNAIMKSFNIMTFAIMVIEVTLWIGSVFYLANYISNRELAKQEEEKKQDREAGSDPKPVEFKETVEVDEKAVEMGDVKQTTSVELEG